MCISLCVLLALRFHGYLTLGDVLSTPRTFSFSTGGVRSAGSFALFDDNVCEGDEIFMAVIDSSSTGFLVQQGQPNVTYIAIKDNDRTFCL